MIFLQINKETKEVVGYSSIQMNANDIEIELKGIDERFFKMPFFFNYIDDELVFDEERYNQYKIRKQNHLTNEQKLGQKCSDLEIQLMMLQQMIMQQSMK